MNSSDDAFMGFDALYFMGEETVWFEEHDSGEFILVCFNYITPVDDETLHPNYLRLQSICVEHGATGDPIGITTEDGERHYAFVVPSERDKSCYLALAKLSAT
jgi:hypothetical protein